MTILQTVEIPQYTWGWTNDAIIPLLIFGFYLFACFKAITTEDVWSNLWQDFVALWAIGLLFGGLLGLGALHSATELPSIYKYQVLIDDETSVSEILKDYEIIEQEGITLWVQEKENGSN